MRPLKPILLFLVLASLVNQTAPPPPYGPAGSEGAPDRQQPWLVPTPAADRAAHAMLYRPPGDGPFRLAVIAHASTQNVLRRAQMPQPDYRALAALLVARGFAVLVPERLGHGLTGSAYLEDQGGCDDADYARAGRATADQILLALEYLRGRSFIRPDGAVVIGHSAGGWGALALAGEDPKHISVIVAFAPGRGGHANDAPDQICARQRLVAAARAFGRGARIPVSWLVAANDSYFTPEFSRQLAAAFRDGGGRVDFQVLPGSGGEGHFLAENAKGLAMSAGAIDRAWRLAPPRPAPEPGK
jgi:dienelactone hydrolase